MVAAALKDFRDSLNITARPEFSVLSIRERLLEAASLSVAERLALAADDALAVNLLEFTDTTLKQMTVTCRSHRERLTKTTHNRDGLAAFEAIRDGKAVLIDDTTRDPRWSNYPKRPYRTVLALPISCCNRFVGSLTIDHATPFRFYGKTSELSLLLEPYIASLTLTFPDSEAYYARDNVGHG